MVRVFCFDRRWGLPTTGPFALKLELWLRVAGIEYERVYENDTRKGPKGKIPWAEIDGEPIADSQLILERLAADRGIRIDAHLRPRERALANAIQRMVEEHLHQCVEFELFVHPAGRAEMDAWLDEVVPWPVRPLAKRGYRRHFERHLHERGITRHSPEEIATMGRRDLDALAEIIPAKGYLFGDRPAVVDASVFGQLALLLYPDYDAPLNQYSKSLPGLKAYCERIFHEWFPEEREDVAAPEESRLCA